MNGCYPESKEKEQLLNIIARRGKENTVWSIRRLEMLQRVKHEEQSGSMTEKLHRQPKRIQKLSTDMSTVS
jgi:hypothetical protein